MIRLLFFVALVLALGFGFAWLADRPGDLSIVWQDRRIEMSLMTAVTVVASLVAAIMISWWLIRTIWLSPRLVSRYFRANKRDRGYQALSTGLLAAGAGDAAMARKMNKRTKGLLSADQEPLIHLLDVQAALIEGRNDEARKLFEAMVEDPETKLLGLRGLYLEAQRQGAGEAARHYAESAAEQAPHLPWAGAAALSYRTQEGKWDEALHLLDRQRHSGTIEAAVADRKKAVLLTARGRDRLDADPSSARDDALAALKLAPAFPPAAIVATKALLRQDNLRKAAKILEAAWKANPHPEIAEAYVRARVGDTAIDRLRRAERLEKLRPMHPQSFDAVARAALDARRFDLAREKAEAAARLRPCEGIYLLLADIEEAETGDQGRVRHWLSQAVRASRDPAWTADGYVSENWEPVSPVTGKLDAFEWKVPVEQLAGPALDNETPAGAFDRAMASLPPVRERDVPAAAPTVVAAAAPVADPIVDALAPVNSTEEDPLPVTAPVVEAEPEHAALAAAAESDDKPEAPGYSDKSAATAPVAKKVESMDVAPKSVKAEPQLGSRPKPDNQDAATMVVAKPSGQDAEDEARAKEAAFLNHRPDDPGVRSGAAPEKPGRFRLF
ncbi:heme biosynthesis protein HemY [Hoeflea sp. G2-23]|uniref:Heme biosynthesis protein HemY n=1 Tax=Hoeflea algicola TaxID=2983763 RepID=A0ABT3ZB14_9HYPH|nr:heme biosynthesis protein HemY [Hoeflea algicola]MCY0148989.1 heme biosynthesis protein HemY [Hoeflea algicola]